LVERLLFFMLLDEGDQRKDGSM